MPVFPGEGTMSRPISVSGTESHSDSPSPEWEVWFEKLNACSGLKDGWNGYTAEAPSEASIRNARLLLQVARAADYQPSRLTASAMGGIAVTWKATQRKVLVESYNDGRVFALRSVRQGDMDVNQVETDQSPFRSFSRRRKNFSMTDVPAEMKQNGRPPDPDFNETEKLFRRFHPDHIDGDEIAPEAFELPDMSVNREKYGPPAWLLLGDDLSQWGVGAFRVRDVPVDEKLQHLGVIFYDLRAEHVPHQRNYPHSEVRIYRDEVRVSRESRNLSLLEPEFHMRWRERLSQCSWVAIQPPLS